MNSSVTIVTESLRNRDSYVLQGHEFFLSVYPYRLWGPDFCFTQRCKNSRSRSHGRLNVLWWDLIFVCFVYETCFISLSYHLQFWVSSHIFGKFVSSLSNVYREIFCKEKKKGRNVKLTFIGNVEFMKAWRCLPLPVTYFGCVLVSAGDKLYF
jgi:hypothetical protein